MSYAKKCGIKLPQEIEFDSWLGENRFSNIKHLTKLDNATQSKLFKWDLITYSNYDNLISVDKLCNQINSRADELTKNGWVYLALNKWCIIVNNIDPSINQLNYDRSLLVYITSRVSRLTVRRYNYIDNNIGNVGNWVHGNTRLWFQNETK